MNLASLEAKANQIRYICRSGLLSSLHLSHSNLILCLITSSPELSQQSVASIPVEQPLTRFRDGGHTQRKHSTIPATCG